MTALIIPIDDAWFHRLRRDMLVHGLQESVRRLIAITDKNLDDGAVAEDHVIVFREERDGLPCDVEFRSTPCGDQTRITNDSAARQTDRDFGA